MHAQRQLHKRSALLFAVAIVAMLTASVTAEEARTWTDHTGKHTTKAELVSFVDGKVTLRKPGTTKTLTWPLKRFSDEDQAYLKRWAESQSESATTEEAGDDSDETVEEQTSNRPRTRPNNVVNSVRGAAFRQQTTTRLRNITLAILNHEASKGRFPAAGTQAGGKPGLSWRVAILPYIEEQALYRQFRQNEPWDSEHNLKLVERMPKVFLSPGSDLPAGYTNFQAIVNDRSIIVPAGLRGIKIRNIRDGTSKTLMLVEVDDTHAAIWTKPDDYEWNVEKPLEGLGHIWSGRFMAAFADGSVRPIPTSVGTDTLNALMTRDGGERVSLD